MKISIVIPHYGDRAHDLLEPCLESIRKYTDMSDTEVIVVANGCTESARQIWMKFVPLCQLLWFDEAIGYARACNEGMKVAKGEFIVLLNNDIEILESPKNFWIDTLLRAFWDERVAISGPMMAWCPYAEHNFLIGFCTMFRKAALDKIGLYDELFEAYGEDTDICIRAKLAGWKIKQVPDDEIRRLDGQPSVGTGNFPIWHKGNESYRNWPGGEALLAKNRKILHDRYATGIGKAHDLDGWMANEELRWLAARAKESKVFVQIGAWHGKSSRAIADNLPPDGRLYDIDAWMGSNAELDTNHWSARLMDGDHAFNEYARGMWDHLASGKVTPLKMRGKNGAALLRDMGIQADTVFIDGGHGKGETAEDITNFFPLKKQSGVICGHDYMHTDGMWPDVGPEVLAAFGGNVGHPERTSIWYTNSVKIEYTPRVYDCFTFFNELELLEIRFNELWDVVDRFVIVEATKTHQGDPKPLYFADNLQRFAPFLSKVTHIVDEFPDEMEVGGGPSFPSGMNWSRERHQREAIMRGLTDCKDQDIIIVSDGDEIARAEMVRQYKPEMGLMRMEMDLYCYYMNCRGNDGWRESKILPYGLLKQLGPCNTRYSLHTIGTHGEPLYKAGWHFSFMGGPERVKEKIKAYSHGEYNTPEILDRVDERLERCVDVFGRDGFTYQMMEVNGVYGGSDHPKYFRDNLPKFRELGFVK